MAPLLPNPVTGHHIHMVGIKGTGMAALAELLHAKKAVITGSDVPERFFTDEILENAGISYSKNFEPSHVPADTEVVIHSSAYFRDKNPELIQAQKLGIGLLSYTEALGQFSAVFSQACGICGVHGKTTTTAMAGMIVKALKLPASVLAGSLVPDFGGGATLKQGNDYFIAETCEYQRHFLSFHPSFILCTSIELDHTDYYKDLEDIFLAFTQYVSKLPQQGTLVYCADEKGAQRLAQWTEKNRPDVHLIPYGLTAPETSPFKIQKEKNQSGESLFTLPFFKETFCLKIPGEHNVLNAAGALALVLNLYQAHAGSLPPKNLIDQCKIELENFHGSRRRSQIVGEVGGILVLDDYGHHPTAIRTTLKGLKDFYPDRRLVVDFMSHTYSRTKALLEDFAASFEYADQVVLHKIYPSAREAFDPTVSGKLLFERTKNYKQDLYYFEEVEEALPYYLKTLKKGDLLITMGAGDNWRVGEAFLKAKKG